MGALAGIYAAKLEGKEVSNELDPAAIDKTNYVFWRFVVDILMCYTGFSFFAVTLGMKKYHATGIQCKGIAGLRAVKVVKLVASKKIVLKQLY